jgi:hydroxymethylpyrimidine pyrophosphatase-like HAD family hydrolase
VIRLVATDLDGTFWGAGMAIPDGHVRAVRELEARGVTVLAATSRRPRVARAGLGTAGLALPAVLVDGALGIDLRTGERFHRAMFEQPVAAAVLGAFRLTGLDPCVYVDDPVIDIVISDTPASCPAHLTSISDVVRVGDLDTELAGHVYAFSVLGLPRGRLEPAARLLLDLGVQLVLFSEARFGEWGLSVNPPGVSKWSGVEAYCRLTGIDSSEVLAVGDGDNDVTMLDRAGVAVAVLGGTPAVLELADHLIDPPAQEGWAALLDLIG